MIRFGVEVSNVMQTIEMLRKNTSDLLYAINAKDGELSHANLMCLKLTLGQVNDQINALMRAYDMALSDDMIKAEASRPSR